MTVIIDYGAGNIKSVEKALLSLGQEVVITDDADTILNAERIILPGVGAFGNAMAQLEKTGLDEVIREAVRRKIPFLGICLGLQLLFEKSDEALGVKGLGVLKGEVKKIPAKKGLKIPHMGWNSLHFAHNGKLFQGIEEGAYVYFCALLLPGSRRRVDRESFCRIWGTYPCFRGKENVFACQFHPEKSGETGLKILKNFTEL